MIIMTGCHYDGDNDDNGDDYGDDHDHDGDTDTISTE